MPSESNQKRMLKDFGHAQFPKKYSNCPISNTKMQNFALDFVYIRGPILNPFSVSKDFWGKKKRRTISEQNMKKYPNCGEKLSIFALNANLFLHKICECFKLPLTKRIYVPESFRVQPKNE